MELPELNSRIRKIIDMKSGGSVKKFAENIGISQQKINRLFNIDTRTNKYPTVTSDVLTQIAEMFVDINPKWLLTGKGTIINADDLEKTTDKSALEMIKELAAENALLKKENQELRKYRTDDRDHMKVAEP